MSPYCLRLLALAGLLWFTQATTTGAAETPRPPESSGERVRVQLVAPQSATLSSELAGRVAALPLREGDAFAAGDLLLQLDCRLYQARHSKAEAERNQARTVHTVNTELDRLGSVSVLDLQIAATQLAVAEAELAIMDALLERCEITAPFSGRIAERHARPHQYIAEGEKVLEILNDDRLEIDMILPSPWLRWLRVGQTFRLTIDETGQTYQAQVSRIAPRIDPVSQSVKIFGLLDNPGRELRAGMSGTAQLSPPSPL